MTYEPSVTAIEFVDRLTSLGPYKPVKRPQALPVAWHDVLVVLLATYNLDGVTLANFRFRKDGLAEDDWYGVRRFSEGYTTDYFVKEGTHDVSCFYYKECFPSPLEIRTDQFLEYLLLEWEYWRAMELGTKPSKSGFLARGRKIADHHLIRKAFEEEPL